ncbi:MAG: type VI secretion system Vgr family protein, partial [Candidatus Competibacteraceae bacterium]|nr:type VI secretion system Vgr family protein [Candidatus Competibacteraceae bacterium]
MPVVSQRQRRVSITGPLGEDVLLLRRMDGHEAISVPFEYQVDLLSEDDQIKLEDVLARPMSLRLDMPQGNRRYFHGMVSRFTQTDAREFGQRLTPYQAILRPWLWFLTRTADCRIFQQQTVPDIVTSLFQEHGFGDFESRLTGEYRIWNYCVQYRETDFNFISRLLEQEGIYYFFRHTADSHTLVLCDDYSAHDPVPGYETIPYYPPQQHQRRKRDHIFAWSLERQVQPGSFAINDFDYLVPKKNLQAMSSESRPHPLADLEIYDYPGEYSQSEEANLYARLRLEELQARHETIRGQGNPYGLTVGALFELENHPRDDQNREHLVTAATWQLVSDAFETGGDGEGPVFLCTFEAQDSQQPFRPARVTPKPVVQGPQTAVVVGKGGEEIWTDEHARVKVQFHWDRYGKSDENSSCWVRVAQVWAGKSWGAIHIPRIGQEVIVEFLEGDPDRPIITGRVYNGDNKPPYGLPANATQSGILSRSSKGGSGANANELRFEDKKGEERVTLHAEKDQSIEVENDESHWVGNDRTKTVDRDETSHIKRDRTETVNQHESITIGVNRTESVGSNETITIGQNRTESVGKNETITVA